MIVDFHTHIFPPAIRQNRDKLFLSEPAFKLLYQSPKSRLVGAAKLLNAMNENGVDKSVIFGFPWKNSDTFKVHNDYIMKTVQSYPDRFIGLGCFDPVSKDAIAEAERCLNSGMSGIGELAFYQGSYEREGRGFVIYDAAFGPLLSPSGSIDFLTGVVAYTS